MGDIKQVVHWRRKYIKRHHKTAWSTQIPDTQYLCIPVLSSVLEIADFQISLSTPYVDTTYITNWKSQNWLQ
jgi:hypothetical protein